jgi:N-acetylglutamate synthase-like GNAT family acetyltransferase
VSEPRAFSIRPAGPSDAGSMQEVASEAYQRYVNRIGRRPRPMTANYDRIAESGHAWVAEEDGRIVGLLVLQPADDHMLLENVAVAPHAQGLGVGARLLQVAEEQARAHDLPEVRLYTNDAMVENLAYYPRRGYQQRHRTTQDGFRRVFFRKLLV